MRLGLTRKQVEAILEKPTARIGDRLIYFRSVRKKNSPPELLRLRREHAEDSDEDFHGNYDDYDLTVYIEISFSMSKVSCLGRLLSETM